MAGAAEPGQERRVASVTDLSSKLGSMTGQIPSHSSGQGAVCPDVQCPAHMDSGLSRLGLTEISDSQ